jgi:hypothetical protein
MLQLLPIHLHIKYGANSGKQKWPSMCLEACVAQECWEGLWDMLTIMTISHETKAHAVAVFCGEASLHNNPLNMRANLK